MPNINVQAHLPRRGLRRNIFQPIVEEGIPPEELWHSGIVERKSERAAEIRIVGGSTIGGLTITCHANVDGFERLTTGFRVKVKTLESQDCPGALIVRRVELGPALTQQVRARLLEVPMCAWSVRDTADWITTLDMGSAITETVQRAIHHDQIDGEQLTALKLDLLRSVLCQPGRLGAEHEPADAAATGSSGKKTHLFCAILW